MTLRELPPITFRPDMDYPVSLAIWHANVNHSPTPISGDMKGMSFEDRTAYRELERESGLYHI